jgi:hypothetical protein
MGQTVTLVKQGGDPSFTSLAVNGPTILSGSFYTSGSLNVSGNIFTSGSLVVSGSIIAQTLIVNSTSYYSGSNVFGNSPSNTQVFTGSMYVRGFISGSSFTGSGAGLTSIPNSALVNSTISGIALGSNLATLTFGTYLTGTSYNGSTGVTIATNATNANTVSTIVARDASGNFSAGTITANLTGNCSGTSNNITAYTINQSVGTSDSPSFNQVLATNNGNGTNFKVGDDAWFGDVNVANTVRLKGVQDATAGYLTFGNQATALGLTNSTTLTWGAAFTATGDVTAFSDIRVKENIKTIEGALDKVLRLRGVTFNRIDLDDKSEKIGVIAQEIQQVLPQVVMEENDRYSVAYGNIVGVLIEAIKEQQKQIEELKYIINGITK